MKIRGASFPTARLVACLALCATARCTSGEALGDGSIRDADDVRAVDGPLDRDDGFAADADVTARDDVPFDDGFDADTMFDASIDASIDAPADAPGDTSTDAPTDTRTPQAPWRAPLFDGRSGYVQIPDNAAYSASTTGSITVEAWMRPDSLSMPDREGSGYVHWMGKGEPNQQEWVARMYQAGNSEGRANRISFYAFNLSGGLGAGSYFQDTVRTGEWIHYVGVINATRTYIYKDGVLRDSDLLSGYNITPRNGTAPVRIGTRDLNSFFQGAIARVSIYSSQLSSARIQAHYAARAAGNYDSVVMAEPSLVGFWRLAETSGTVAVDARAGRNGRYVSGVRPGAATWALP